MGREARYVYGIGLIAEKAGEETRVYHFNHLGNTTAITDMDGSVEKTFTYGTYGELTSGDPEGTSFLFCGEYGIVTDHNGLYYMRARYYNVDVKRFINRDTLRGEVEDAQSLNRYSYVQGNPVQYIDPTGHFLFALPFVIPAGTVILLEGAAVITTVGIVYETTKDMTKDDWNRVWDETKEGVKQAVSSVKDFVTSPWRDNSNVALNRPIRIKRDGGYIYKYHLVVEPDLTFNDSIILQKKTDEGSCKDKEKNKGDGEADTKEHPNGEYVDAPYHGKTGNSTKSKAPKDGQTALDDSIPIDPENTDRRIGVSEGEIVVLDKTSKGEYHGHVRTWNELTQEMKNALYKNGKTNLKGKIK